MVLRCFGEEKGKAGKRESGVNLGGGGDRRCFYTLDTFFLNTSPLNGSCIRGTWVFPSICLTIILVNHSKMNTITN